jgi:hypothetical protein
MRGAIPPLPNASSWRGAYFSTGKILPLHFYIYHHHHHHHHISQYEDSINLNLGKVTA